MVVGDKILAAPSGDQQMEFWDLVNTRRESWSWVGVYHCPWSNYKAGVVARVAGDTMSRRYLLSFIEGWFSLQRWRISNEQNKAKNRVMWTVPNVQITPQPTFSSKGKVAK